MSLARIRLLFLIAGLYDVLISLTFLAFGGPLLDRAGIPQPNHWGYLQFAALELLIFGSMLLAVGRDPIRNGNLIVYGLMLKMSYVGLVGYYWARGDCPLLFQPFAVIDAAMFVLFLRAYSRLRSRDAQSSPESV